MMDIKNVKAAFIKTTADLSSINAEEYANIFLIDEKETRGILNAYLSDIEQKESKGCFPYLENYKTEDLVLYFQLVTMIYRLEEFTKKKEKDYRQRLNDTIFGNGHADAMGNIHENTLVMSIDWDIMRYMQVLVLCYLAEEERSGLHNKYRAYLKKSDMSKYIQKRYDDNNKKMVQ